MKGALIRNSLLMVFASWSSLSAHSGGTDRYGCHAGRLPYHCHNNGDDRNMSLIASTVVVGVVVVAFYFWHHETNRDAFAYVRLVGPPVPQLRLSELLQPMTRRNRATKISAIEIEHARLRTVIPSSNYYISFDPIKTLQGLEIVVPLPSLFSN